MIVFAGTARNVGRYLAANLRHIDRCGARFKSYAVVIYENDSTDNTRKIMEFHKKPNYHYLYETDVPGRRTEILARGRNAIVDKVIELNATYMVMLDLDDVNHSGSFVDNIQTCFAYKGWDMLAANQKERYYDVWALRKKGLMEVDCWRQIRHLSENEKKKHRQFINSGICFRGSGLVPVQSAFGGMAIYRVKALEGCRYRGTHADGTEKCEHVDFHLDMLKKGSKLFINTDFINDGPPLLPPKMTMLL